MQALVLVFVFILAACGASTLTSEEPGPSNGISPSLESSKQAVIVFSAGLRKGPGKGYRLGTLEPDTVVSLGEQRDGWQQVEVRDDLRVSGWVRRECVGCRALRDVPLRPLDGREPEVKLRRGALLALRATLEERLEVETQGPVTARGFIATADCGVGLDFVPTLPRDGIPHLLLREAQMSADFGGGQSVLLPEKQRFAVFEREGRDAIGRTDGPVVVRGRIDARALTRDKTTPFDRLAEPMSYTHEVVLEAALSTKRAGGEIFVNLPGGTNLELLEVDREWASICTAGRVRLRGWVELRQSRRVALDHNALDPAARRREHAPLSHETPRGMELLDEPDDEQ